MPRTVVAGVGGSGGWSALAWAADEAAATGARLVVCHVCPVTSALAGMAGTVAPGRLELADPALARAVATVRTRLGGNRVTLTVQTGRPGPALTRASVDADLVVIGAPQYPRPGGYGSTAHHVAANAPCPVVMVRPVTGGRGAPFAGHVVVGVDDSAAGRAALEFGFGYADLHRLPLAAVHVSAERRGDFRFDDVTLSPHLPAEPAVPTWLATEVEPWTHKYPDVPVKRAVLAAPVVSGLLRGAQGARLLVVGDHRRGAAARALLGTVTHATLDRARCPVAVVHAYDRRGDLR
jgi:nucleotide-binding universal stress UspA family protein